MFVNPLFLLTASYMRILKPVFAELPPKVKELLHTLSEMNKGKKKHVKNLHAYDEMSLIIFVCFVTEDMDIQALIEEIKVPGTLLT